MELQPGTLVLNGRYRIERLLGAGGSGEVYLVTQASFLQGQAALKILRRGEAGVDTVKIENYRARFELEGRLQSELGTSPGIVRVFDGGDHDGSPVLVMDYMSGGTLKQENVAAAGKGQPWQRCADVLRESATGLQTLHARGYVHRDVKPSNILLDAHGQAKIADLGVVQTEWTRTRTDGTPHEHPRSPGYASPEHANPNAALSPAADVYALGVIGFEMLSGHLPHPSAPDQPVEPVGGDVPAWLTALITRMLAFDYRERPKTGEAVARAIRDGLRDERDGAARRVARMAELGQKIEAALGKQPHARPELDEADRLLDELRNLAPADPRTMDFTIRVARALRVTPVVPPEPAPEPIKPLTRQERLRQVAELREDLEPAQREQRWRDVVRISEALLDLVPDDSEATAAMEMATRELVKRGREASRIREALRKSMVEEAWDRAEADAQALLELSPDDSEALQAMASLQYELERQRVAALAKQSEDHARTELRSAFRGQSWLRVSEAARSLLELAPDDDEARRADAEAQVRIAFKLGIRRLSASRAVLTLAPGVEIEFVRIPAGPFIMGSKKPKAGPIQRLRRALSPDTMASFEDSMARDDELPQHVCTLPAYWISRTPVTVAQFSVFFRVTSHLTTAEADGSSRAWVSGEWVDAVGAYWARPFGRDSDVMGKEDHPVTHVSWDDAAAFCRWASRPELGEVDLPTEAEWEKAARGTSGQIYAWGNEAPDSGRCNFAPDNERDTTPVGTYGAMGASPYGCDDMCGNVWEWTRETKIPYPYLLENGHVAESSVARVIRGGSFDYSSENVRCACRSWDPPDRHYCHLGFRVVIRPSAFAPDMVTDDFSDEPNLRDNSRRGILRAGADCAVLELAPGVEIEFVRVPGGEFLMGSSKENDNQTCDDELPQHVLLLQEYWIGKCPVTVAQFRPFRVAAGMSASLVLDPLRKGQHPVSGLGWASCIEFCRWASMVTGENLSLPTEAEWEKAARGIDGRIFPWGNEEPDSTRLNFNRIEPSTTPVGKYGTLGRSPYGCDDMAGNVWEWTSSGYFDYPYSPDDGRESELRDQERVQRGGSYTTDRRGVRCSNRIAEKQRPTVTHAGFRVVIRHRSIAKRSPSI